MIRHVDPNKTASYLFISSLLLFSLAVSVFAPENFGTEDFIEYWSAFSIFTTGHNPYSPLNMGAIQQAVLNSSFTKPQMMWNPPWILTIFAPVLCWPFPISSKIFLGLQLISIGLGLKLLLSDQKLNSTSERLKIMLAVSSFFPIFISLKLGQLGGILFFGFSLLIYSISKKKPLVGAIGILMLSVKPHLAGPALLALSFQKDLRPIFVRAIILILLACIAALLVSPQIVFNWIEPLTLQNLPGTILPWQWKTASISGLIGTTIKWIPNAILLFNAVLLLYLSLKLRTLQSTELVKSLITTSVILSPFVWIFDQVMLVPLLLSYLLINKTRSSKVAINLKLGVILIINLSAWSLYATINVQHYYYVWHGPVLSLVWLIAFCKNPILQRQFGA